MKINYKIFNLILIAILLFALGFKVISAKEADFKKNLAGIFLSSPLEVKPVSAKEIYPMFECPCCGKSIDECTCPMSKERRAFVDGLTSTDIAEEEAVASYVKKYGLESFMDEKKKEEFREKLAQEAPADRPIIAINSTSHDFGDVSQQKGVVTISFAIKNEGKSDLVIDKLESSCGCTSASVIYREKEGPKFTMPGHETDEKTEGWQVVISPEEKAQLKVYYDPDVHQDFRGEATRTVSIFSNDPVDFEKKVSIELNQVD